MLDTIDGLCSCGRVLIIGLNGANHSCEGEQQDACKERHGKDAMSAHQPQQATAPFRTALRRFLEHGWLITWLRSRVPACQGWLGFPCERDWRRRTPCSIQLRRGL